MRDNSPLMFNQTVSKNILKNTITNHLQNDKQAKSEKLKRKVIIKIKEP
jgi:hypothetical protein